MLSGSRTRPTAPLPVPGRRWTSTAWWAQHSLRGRRSLAIGSAYGLVTCSGSDCSHDLYTHNGALPFGPALASYADLIPNASALLSRPLVLNANILLENTPSNRLLVWDWLGMAVAEPTAFCFPHVQDQAAFTILVLNRSLPLLNVCPYLGLKGKQRCVTHTKDTNNFLSLLGRGMVEVVESDELDRLAEGYERAARHSDDQIGIYAQQPSRPAHGLGRKRDIGNTSHR